MVVMLLALFFQSNSPTMILTLRSLKLAALPHQWPFHPGAWSIATINSTTNASLYPAVMGHQISQLGGSATDTDYP